MPKPMFQAAAEGLPTRRRVLKGLAVSAIVVTLPTALQAAAPIEMPADLPPYALERWKHMSPADRAVLANNWRAMDAKCRHIIERWCLLSEEDKDSVLEEVERREAQRRAETL